MKDAIKKNTFYVGCITAFIVAVLVFTCCCWLTNLYRRSDGVRSDGITVQEVERQLDRVSENQREIQNIAGEIEGAAGNIRQEVSGAREEVRGAGQSLSELESENNRAGELIAECQSILGGARKRVQSKNQED